MKVNIKLLQRFSIISFAFAGVASAEINDDLADPIVDRLLAEETGWTLVPENYEKYSLLFTVEIDSKEYFIMILYQDFLYDTLKPNQEGHLIVGVSSYSDGVKKCESVITCGIEPQMTYQLISLIARTDIRSLGELFNLPYYGGTRGPFEPTVKFQHKIGPELRTIERQRGRCLPLDTVLDFIRTQVQANDPDYFY